MLPKPDGPLPFYRFDAASIFVNVCNVHHCGSDMPKGVAGGHDRCKPFFANLNDCGCEQDHINEQQRVAIARSLITHPAIVFADEPTGSLDSVTGQAICKWLRELCNRQHRTIVVLTHEPSVAAWADEVVAMKDGTIVERCSANRKNNAQALAAHYQQIAGGAGIVVEASNLRQILRERSG